MVCSSENIDVAGQKRSSRIIAMSVLCCSDLTRLFSGGRGIVRSKESSIFEPYAGAFLQTKNLIEENLDEFEHIVTTTAVFDSAYQHVKDYVEVLEQVESKIAASATHWKVKRMPLVDRNILRIAVVELSSTEIPREIIINEAIEIAKLFGGNKSAAFVNGVLDHLS